jgi:hypothetical protein
VDSLDDRVVVPQIRQVRVRLHRLRRGVVGVGEDSCPTLLGELWVRPSAAKIAGVLLASVVV